MKHQSPVALITGGSRGIGFGIAMALAEAGYDLAINGMRPSQAVSESLEKLRAFGHQVIYCQGDVSEADDRKKILAQVRKDFGRLNVLVNNAGITSPDRKDILESQESSFDKVMAVNLKGPFFLTQDVANWMIQQQQETVAPNTPNYTGSIIQISSISATVPSINRGDYCLSKAALGMATKLWATRMAEFGIGVYEVRPGLIATDMTAVVSQKYDQMIADGLTLQPRWGQPSDVGKAVAMLASGQLPYSTGQVIMVDGGLTLPRL